jgi:putative lipoprotein
MRTRKFYLLLAPTLISALFCAYNGYKYYKDFTALNDLEEKLNKQSLALHVSSSTLDEHDALTGKSQTNINKLRGNTLKNAQNFINSTKINNSSELRNVNKLKEVLANLNQTDKFEDYFYDFFKNISGETNADFEQILKQNLPSKIKNHAATLNQIYKQLSLVNDAEHYVRNILVDRSLAMSNDIIKDNLYYINDNMFGAIDLLPEGELKENIYDSFSQLENNYKSKNLEEARAKVILSGKLSPNDIKLIKQYEDDKFHLLLNSAINIQNGLKNIIKKEKLESGLVALFTFLLSGLLFLSSLGIFTRLKFLKMFANKSTYIKEHILQSSDANVNINNAISKLIKAYEILKETYTEDNNFYQIKNKHISSISKKLETINKEILTFIMALKTEINENKKQAIVSIIEKNVNITISLYNNAKNISNTKKIKEHNTNEHFYPQKSFEEMLQTNIIYSQNKKINFISYIDPTLINELEGDLESLKAAFNSIFLASLSMSSKYQNLIIQIKKVKQEFSKNGLCTISFSIKNNSTAMSEEQILDLFSNNKTSIDNDESEFYLKIAQTYLKNLESKLEISSLQNVGNDFKFTVIFKTTPNHKEFNISSDHKLAFLQDANIVYNDFFEKTVNELGLKVDILTNSNTIAVKSYDAVFLRNTSTKAHDIKNPLILKDPLTPLAITRQLFADDLDALAKDINNKPRILICDPNEFYIEITASGFRKISCEVVGVCNKKDLKQVIKQGMFDLIFISSKLFEDEENSFGRSFNLLKTATQNTKTPLILMLSNTSNIDENSTKVHFDATIKTPINSDDLIQLFKNFLPHSDNLIANEILLNKSENIILFKKTPMENKIFSSALGEFYNTLETANSFDELLIKIKTKTYGIVLVDENTKDFNYKELIKIVSETRQSKMINTKLLIFGTKERVDLPFVKMLAENISKAELAATVRAQLDTTTDDKTKDSYEFIKFSS